MVKTMQLVFNTFSSGLLVENTDRQIMYVNKKFLEIFGIDAKPEELEGMDCAGTAKDFMHLFKHPDLFVEDIEEILQGGKEQKDQVELADGRVFVRKYSPIYDEGKLHSHVWNYEEVTILKEKEDELLHQKEFFHTVLNEIPADVAIFSPQHRYIYLNKTAIKSDGIRKWMIGKDDYEYVEMRGLDVSIADERRAKFNKAKDSREAVSWITEHPTPDGKKNYVLRIFYPYINPKDEMEFMIGYGVNINQQKEGELAVALEKERFRTLIDTLNDGVFQMTFDANVQFCNRAFLNLMHLGEMDIKGQYRAEVMENVYPEDRKLLYAAFDTLKDTHLPQQGVFRRLNPDTGDTAHIEYYIWCRRTEADGEVVAGRLSDITERTLREANMQRLITKEKELNNLKSHFIHITSHELRTPLSVIMSSAEILEMCETSGEEVAAMIDTHAMTSGIVKEVNRITDILDELLMVGRIESGKIKFEPVQVDVREYIHSVAGEMFMPHADGRSLQIHIDDEVKTAFFDKSLMRHAINNLVGNAFKYSPGKEAPELSLYKSSNNLVVEVKDHGIGIPQEELDNLFTSFYRASNVGNISGTGIGLMVVEHVAKTHNGTITVTSKQTEGSVFTMQIPLKK
ncbi:MAG: PAS domain-containing protein [Chitinophagales bacterium]|nr:PAS domain-containing protein [Chitinophagales bacterium]